MEYKPVLEKCVVECVTCGRYKMLASSDECPFVCDRCCTPGLKIISREPVDFPFWQPVQCL